MSVSTAQLLRFNVPLTIQAAANKGKKPTVEIVAYTGGILRAVRNFGDVVIDLSGLQLPNVVTLLDSHNDALTSVVGSGKPVVENNQLLVRGSLSVSTESGQRILQLTKDGIELQASIGPEILASERLAPGESIQLNGRTITARNEPLLLVSRSILREVSIVVSGVDENTTVSIAAAFNNQPNKEQDMPTEAETNDNTLVAHRQKLAAEERRVEGIRSSYDSWVDGLWGRPVSLNASYLKDRGIEGVSTPGELRAYAIEAGWDRDKFELELRRSERQDIGHIGIHTGGPRLNDDTLECALMGHLRGDVEKHYQPQTIEASKQLGVHHFYDVVKLALQASGQFRSSYSQGELLTAAFSTTSLPTALNNVQNKTLSMAGTAGFDARSFSAHDARSRVGRDGRRIAPGRSAQCA